jgi:uncharacterized protein YukE
VPPADTGPTSGPGAGWDRTIRVDDPARLTEAAGAFWRGLEALSAARARFVTSTHALGHDLGDPALASRYEDAHRQALRTVDALSDCFEQLFRALSAIASSYEQTDDSVARRMR